MSTPRTANLPSFDRPPVVETVLGVQFEPLAKLYNAHLGAFWKKLGPDWPEANDAPLLESQHERFGEASSWARGLQLKLTQDPANRLQVRSRDGDRMVQAQNGRFHYNWLGRRGRPYPRYTELRPAFDKAVDVFLQFLTEESLGELRPTQWEVTYVNHLPKTSVWNDPRDWSGVFKSLPGPWSGPASVQLESLGGEWHYEIEPHRGRLHVQLLHMRRGPAAADEILRLTLTARGPVAARDEEGLSLDEGLNLGHATIVRAFYDMTSESAHQYWGFRDDTA